MYVSTTLKWHSQFIAISTCRYADEMVVSFNRTPLSFETAFTWLLYFQSVANNPLWLSAERWQAFLKSLYLLYEKYRWYYSRKSKASLHAKVFEDDTFRLLCRRGVAEKPLVLYPRVSRSIPGSSSQSVETLKPWPRLNMTLAVGGTLNTKLTHSLWMVGFQHLLRPRWS